MVDMNKTVFWYILEFCLYDLEPLHIVLGALLSEKMIIDADEIIPLIIHSFKMNYIDLWWQSGYTKDDYEKVNTLTEDMLVSYIQKNIHNHFKKYPLPENGGEYFIKTTFSGEKLIPPDYEHP